MANKVMYLVDRYLGQGGSEGQILQLITHLDRSRYEAALAALRPTSYLEWYPPPCPTEVLGIRRIASVRSALRMLRFAARLRRDGFSIVHCFFNDSSMLAPPFMRLFGIRTIVSRRDMGFWQTPKTLAVCRRVAPFVDRYVVNARAVRDFVQQAERVPREKIDVIYNGYVPPTEAELAADVGMPHVPLPEEVPVVGIVANLKPVKRIDTLVRAFARVAHAFPDARLVVVGADSASPRGGRMRDELASLASALGVVERVVFTGVTMLPLHYVRRFDVAVLCSESEGLSNAIIEYMACGKPVVCTDTGGSPELVRHGVDGFLVPVGDDDALAARIAQLLGDPDLARRMGAAGREAALSRHTLTRMIEQQMACYDRLLTPSWRAMPTASEAE